MTVSANPMDAYTVLNKAFEHFNARLFEGKLSSSLILLHRKKGALGYFWADKLSQNGSKTTVHEIALNPSHIKSRTPRQTFSTLAHEMVHQLQQEHGKPPKGAYHNREWAAMMKTIGLHPSDTAQKGGAETGRYVSHYIIDGGPFALAFEELDKKYNLSLFGEMPSEAKKGKVKTSKFKFACPECGQNAWAKECAALICGECDEQMRRDDSL